MPELAAESVRGLERTVRGYLPGLTMERHGDHVRVCHGWPADVERIDDLGRRSHERYALAPWNRLYYETDLRERETDSEDATDERDTEYAVSLPSPSDLFARFKRTRDADHAALPVDGITARADPDLFDQFHERIEECKLRANRLEHERYDDLPAEWNPTSEYTTRSQTADVLAAQNDGRKDAHYADFADVVGLRYGTLFTARHTLVTGSFDRTESSRKLARETVGVTDEYQCGECDALLPPVELLQFNSYWLCDECADDRKAPSAVAEARERRFEAFADDLDREDWQAFDGEFHYSIRVWLHYPDDHSRSDERQYFVLVEQGGDEVSMFAASVDRLRERVADLLGQWSEREIIAGRLVGPVPLDVETVHVEDETDADLAPTDVIPQTALSDFDHPSSSGKA